MRRIGDTGCKSKPITVTFSELQIQKIEAVASINKCNRPQAIRHMIDSYKPEEPARKKGAK